MKKEDYDHKPMGVYTFSSIRDNLIYATPIDRLVEIFLDKTSSYMADNIEEVEDLEDIEKTSEVIEKKLVNLKVTVKTQDGHYQFHSERFNVGDSSVRFVLGN